MEEDSQIGMVGHAPATIVTTDRQLTTHDKLTLLAKAAFYNSHPREQGNDWHGLPPATREIYLEAVVSIKAAVVSGALTL